MSRIHSYPKVYNLGHPAIRELFEGPVVVQEKVDGSQFSFGRTREPGFPLVVRSKSREFDPQAPDALFVEAAEHVRRIELSLVPGWVYRAEVVRSPRHNTLTYGRVPRNCIVLFDVEVSEQNFMAPDAVEKVADVLDLESVPTLAAGNVDRAIFEKLLETESCLGGCRVEGLVVKNYARFGVDGKALMGKHIQPAFREMNAAAWRAKHPANADIRERVAALAKSEARWLKALQHLRERGELQDAPQDIGPLLREVQSDVEQELAAPVQEMLWAWIRKDVLRAAGRGLPEWYKARLLEKQFVPVDALNTGC